MSDINTGKPSNQRFGMIYIGDATGTYASLEQVKNVQDGSLDVDNPGPDSEINMDNGAIDDAIVMDDRVARIKLAVKVGTLDGAQSIIDKVKPGHASGVMTYFSIRVVRPAYKGATIGSGGGSMCTYAKCYVPESATFKQTSGKGFDIVEFEVVSLNPPAPKDAWVAWAAS